MGDPNFRVLLCREAIINIGIPKNNTAALELQNLSEIGIRVAYTLTSVVLSRSVQVTGTKY